MSRSKRFTQSLLTGYGTIGVNIITSLLSVPLALAYLSREEFGLWALALQINGYLSLVDIGMNGAIGRFLADHKDDVNSKGYTEHLATGSCVFIVQALLISSIGLIFSEFAPSILSIRAELHDEFSNLLRILCVITGITVAFRAFGSPLWAFQRMDVIYIATLIGLIVHFFSMWLGFSLGYGVLSFAFAGLLPTIITVYLYVYFCKKNSYYPAYKSWFRPKYSVFCQMFQYGKDGMLLSIGSQLVNATQITIIGRTLGLDAAATYSIATKPYIMCIQLISKLIESAAPGLTEIFIRGQKTQFIRRYWDMIILSLAISSIGVVSVASANSAFIEFWTGGKVIWTTESNILLGLMVLMSTLSGYTIGIFGITKNLKPVRLLFFFEGIVFVPSAILAVKWFGMEGIIGASIIVHILVTFWGSSRVALKIIGTSKIIILPLLYIGIGCAFGYVIAWITTSMGLSTIMRLMCALIPIYLMALVAWKLIIPQEIRIRISSGINLHKFKLLFKSNT